MKKNIFKLSNVVRYYEDGLLTLSIMLLGIMILIAGLGIFMFVQLGTEPDPLLFYVNENEQFIDPVPLDKPALSDAALLNWLTDLLIQAFSFNYSTQAKAERVLLEYLDARGLDTYRDLLRSDRDLSSIRLRKMIVSVQLTATPEILNETVVNGRYMWQVLAPIRISMQNAESSLSQDRRMEFLIWRVPETDSPNGVRVTQFTAEITSRQAPQTLNAQN